MLRSAVVPGLESPTCHNSASRAALAFNRQAATHLPLFLGPHAAMRATPMRGSSTLLMTHGWRPAVTRWQPGSRKWGRRQMVRACCRVAAACCYQATHIKCAETAGATS